MKKTISLILTAVLALTLFSCAPTPISQEKIEKNYTEISDNASQMYFDAIDNLTSGEVILKYSESKTTKSTTVKFSTKENGEKLVLAQITYADGGLLSNYFDGQKLYIVVDGKGKEVETEYVKADSVYYNLLGAPEEYMNSESNVTAYKKNDDSGYLIVGENDYDEEGKTTVNFYLDKNKTPKKLEIYTTYSNSEDEKATLITMTYTKLGEKINITAPEFELIQE